MEVPQQRSDECSQAAWYAAAMERLVEVVQELSLARDLASVMDIVRHAARELTGADGATFVLRDGDRCFYAEEDAIEPLWKGQRFPMSACISGWVMLNRTPAAIEDIYADPRIPAQAYRPTFVRSLAMVPIRTLDPIGAIGNYWADHHVPSPDELRVLRALADTTAVALENVRVYEELESRVARRTAALQAILDNVEVGVAFTVGGRIERANPKLLSILHAGSNDAIVDRPLHGVLRMAHVPDDTALHGALQSGAAPDELVCAEVQALRLDGDEFWARIVGRSLDESGSPRSTIWVIDDITVAKSRERALDELRMAAEQATRFKSEFLASMSHELRTPLNAIIGFSEVLRDGLAGELAPRQQEYVGDIFDSGQHLLSLINDILDLSKIEAGKMTLDAEPVDVAQMLRSSLSIVKEKAMAHSVTLRGEGDADLGAGMLDPRKFKQIAYNLLSNAVKVTPSGGDVVLRWEIIPAELARSHAGSYTRVVPPWPASSAGRVLQVSVSDTGIGISEDDIARLFQPFTQIDSSLSRQYQGTGLGLTLVCKLCALHGGSVGLRSARDSGSTFTVWLPWVDAPSLPSAAPYPVIERNAAETPLALIVEDDDRAASLLSVQIEELGCSVLRARSAEDALVMLRGELPDLILLDVILPGIDGWELLSRLKSDERLAPIPVVVMSIVADSGKGIALGAVEALQKPVPARRLREVLRRLHLLRPGDQPQSSAVLVVDDDPQALDVVASLLEADGCTTWRAGDGTEALELARRHVPDLIVLDLLMPGLTGFEVLSELRADASTADIPVVILTAKSIDAEDRARLNGGAFKIIEKSNFNDDRLRCALRRALVRN